MQLRAATRISWCLIGMALFGATPILAGTIGIQWDPVPGAAGYKIYHGTTSGQYGAVIDVGNTNAYTLQNMANCTDHHIAVKAYNGSSEESFGFSNEVSGWPRPSFDAQGSIQAMQGKQLTVDITGTNFQSGAEIILDASSLPADIVGNPLMRFESASVTSCSQVQALVTVEPMARGFRAMEVGSFSVGLEVRNPDNVYGTRSLPLNVTYNPERADLNRSDSVTRDRVDGQDLVWLAYSHGTLEGDARYNPDADLNGDGEVDGVDLSFLSVNFGQCWNGSAWSTAACP